jgi:hypothetical protein
VQSINQENIRPNEGELQFLTLAFNRFYDIFEKVMEDNFWELNSINRFGILKDGLSIYTELLNYEPIKWVIDKMKIERPPMEAEIGGELFKFFRNVILHFPLFDTWDEVYVTKTLANWDRNGQSIDKFLEKYKGKPSVKYRFWEEKKKLMTYLEINFPSNYESDIKIYLKDILKEKEGLKFSFVLMKQIIDTQVVK